MRFDIYSLKAGIILSMMLLFSCSQENNNEAALSEDTAEIQLFDLHSSDQSGLSFSNKLTETMDNNIGNHDYFYNGGGVSIADVNQDGLKDIFFTGNQVPNALYLNQGDLSFKEVSEEAQIGADRWSSGSLLQDFNNDGLVDIYVSCSGPSTDVKQRTNMLFVNQGISKDGIPVFKEMAKDLGVADRSMSTHASWFDYDLDGDLDLFVMNHSSLFNFSVKELNERIDQMSSSEFRMHSSSLYRNDGSRFTDVTESAGVLKFSYGLGLITKDLNNDGLVDIYVANDFHIPDYMFINQGNGTFKEQIKDKLGHVPYFSMGCDADDINNDGLIDIANLDMSPSDHIRNKMLMSSMNVNEFRYLTGNENYVHQYMFNSLQINNGFGIFSDIALLAGVSQTDWSWSALLADFDNDGMKDYFVTNGFKRDTKNNDWRKQVLKIRDENNGHIPKEAYWEMLQKAETNPIPNYLFRNKNGYEFEDMSEEWGMGQESLSNGAAFGDLDNDGDLDVVVNNIDKEAFLYENKASNLKNNFIRVDFSKMKNISDAQNAKITIFKGDERKFSEFNCSRGFQSSMEQAVHFGLGDWNSIDSIHISWLKGVSSRFIDPKINQTLQVNSINTNNFRLAPNRKRPPFFDVTNQQVNMKFQHKENDFDDLKKEVLLPHFQSRLGPCLAVGDVNGDKLEDFYVGGANGQSGALYLQNAQGQFRKSTDRIFEVHKQCEDLGAKFIDVDQDGDLDLYVASGGGGEFEGVAEYLQDRLYINNGPTGFSFSSNALPKIDQSTSSISANDFDGDGDLDLFVGGRTNPGNYPSPCNSYLLINEGGLFKDYTKQYAPDLEALGMVTSSKWTDVDNDKDLDLVVIGEWMSLRIFENHNNNLSDNTEKFNIPELVGWWSSLEVHDFNKDGKMDFVIGNIGKNNKFHPKTEKPLHVFYNDFDENGTKDIVLSKKYRDYLVPVRGKECSTEQMPFIADRFPKYEDFSGATIEEILDPVKLDESIHYTATEFSSGILLSGVDGYKFKELPIEAQFAPINAIIIEDFDRDGNTDLIVCGNNYTTEPETPKYDAGKGLFLKGRSDGGFDASPRIIDNGLFIAGDSKSAQRISLGANQTPAILVANNDSGVQLFMKI